MLGPWVYRAKPSLAGMAIVGGPRSAPAFEPVVPWLRVGRLDGSSSLWQVYETNGVRSTVGGRKVMLRVDDARSQRVSRRAQWRAILRAWDSGVLELTERYRGRRADGWTFIVVGIAATGFCLGLPARAIQANSGLVTVPSFWLSMLLPLVIALYGPVGARYGISLLGAADAWRIDRRGVRAEYGGGRSREGAWAELRRIRVVGIVHRLEFASGVQIDLKPTGRTRPVVSRLLRDLEPPTAAPERRWLGVLRACWPLLVMLVASGIGMAAMARMRNPSMPMWKAVVTAVAPVALIAAAPWINSGVRRWTDRARRRRTA